jgi:Ca2+-binding RTX toxin-like protein
LQINIKNLQKGQKTAVLIGAVVVAISAGLIPNIAIEAVAAFIVCRSGQSSRTGTSGTDSIFGTDGKDNISGLGCADAIFARGGDDTVYRGPGSDSMVGGSGDDTHTGGAGADQFDCGAGTDTVTDFNEDEGDTVQDNCENVEEV